MTADIFSSPALPLLVELEARGFTFKVGDGDRLLVRPADQLTPEQRTLLQQERHAAVLLIRVCDAGVQARREMFEAQLAEMPALCLSSLLFRPAVPLVVGVCFSCGDANDRRMARGQLAFGVCLRCALARRLAVRATIPADLAAAYDEARQVA